MKTRFTILSLLVLLSLNTFAQKWLSVNPELKPINKIELIKSSSNEMIIDVSINNYYKKSIENQSGVIIQSDGATTLQVKGAPDLPKMVSSLVIPNDKKMKTEYFDVEYTEFQNVEILPSKGAISRTIDPSSVEYTYGNEYETNEFYPNSLASISNPYIMRDVRGITVQFTPFQYNPITKVLRIYTHYKVRVYTNGETDNINVLNVTKETSEIQSDFNTVYKRHFLNYASGNEKYTPIEEGTPGRMLIISYGDFMDEMQDFVDWKNQKGILTEMVDVSTIGNSSAIKTYVQDYYNNHSDFSYLLLVGDNAQVPVSSATGGDSDNNYGYLAGSDHRIDIFVGRFSAESSADVTTQVERTVRYERDINETESWMQRALGIASNEGAGQGDDGESDIEHIDNINTDLTNYGYTNIATVYQGQGTATDISTAINNDVGIINYVGHGDTQMWASVDPSGYTNTHVNALTNDNHLPFIFTVACVSGDFKNNTCFGEAWQRATNGGKPTGAIANIASTINQSWQSPMCAQDEMDDILVESYTNNIKRTFGGLSANGWGQMIDEYNTDGENMADTWTCFGDASIMVRTKQPQLMTISHSAGINIGATTFNVSCDVEGALVSITKDNVILGTGYSAGGSVNVALNPSVSGTGSILVTVTAYNKVTYQQTVNVITSSNPPVCDFSGTPLTILEGETVTFTDLSTEYPTTWSWSFAGGTPATSTQMNPVITYTTAGTYEVTLYVENPNGNDTETKSAYVTVNPNTNAPTPDFTADVTTILEGSSVNFTDLTTNNPQSWAWEFEGGTPSTSTDQNPTNITYSTAGIYQVALTATNSNGSNTETKVSYINVNIPDPCDAGATNQYAWEYIDGFACGSINNQGTNLSSGGYEDYTNLSTEIVAGNTYTATVTIGNAYSSDQVYAWADWNMDADFDDADENIFNSSTNGQGSYTFDFTVPAGASTGNIRLRVRLNDSNSNPSITEPCGISSYGEVEDYTLTLSPILSIEDIETNLFEVYPNPNNGTFTVRTKNSVETISVTTLTGKIIYSENGNSNINTIQLNELEKGIYFVKVQSNDKIQVKKIIIE